MLMIPCIDIGPGMRSDEITGAFADYEGKEELLRLTEDYLVERGGKRYLPVAVLRESRDRNFFLIEFPHESYGGTNRIWVKRSEVLIEDEAYA